MKVYPSLSQGSNWSSFLVRFSTPVSGSNWARASVRHDEALKVCRRQNHGKINEFFRILDTPEGKNLLWTRTAMLLVNQHLSFAVSKFTGPVTRIYVRLVGSNSLSCCLREN